MQYILAANILENSGFINFLEDALLAYPEANFIVTGDMLNTFPETIEHLRDSLFYELYGRLVLEEMDKLNLARFRIAKHSPFAKPLQEMFSPMGKYYQKVQTMAVRRYERIFSHIEAILGQNNMYFISGDMDYPALVECVTRRASCFHSLDSKLVTLDGTKFSGIGGTPENIRPVPGVIDLTPNEMATAEFKRKLRSLWGVDVLVTHIAPEESGELRDFIKKSPVKLVICKTPFIRKNQESWRGKLEISTIKNTYIIKVRPFEIANHKAMVIDISNNDFDLKSVDIFEWSLPAVESVSV